MKKLLIFVAFGEELKAVRDSLGDDHCDVIMTGMGMVSALAMAEKHIDPADFFGVLVLGFCGGLSKTLQVGDAVIPSKVISSKDGQVFEIGWEMTAEMKRAFEQEGIRSHVADLITQPLVVETREEKQRLFESSGAWAVDMEISEVVRVAVQRHVPVAAAKVVIDDAKTQLPKFNQYFKKTGQMKHLPALSPELSRNVKRGSDVLRIITPKAVSVVFKSWTIVGK